MFFPHQVRAPLLAPLPPVCLALLTIIVHMSNLFVFYRPYSMLGLEKRWTCELWYWKRGWSGLRTVLIGRHQEQTLQDRRCMLQLIYWSFTKIVLKIIIFRLVDVYFQDWQARTRQGPSRCHRHLHHQKARRSQSKLTEAFLFAGIKELSLPRSALPLTTWMYLTFAEMNIP